ncbi:alpha1,3-fucosyltransferase [Aphelenchoides avenae]|nr:alpha1,3-fucosyltransferase [Aphelenchus avenae]
MTVVYSAFLVHEYWDMARLSESIFARQKPNGKRTILMWTTYYDGSRPTQLLDGCPQQEQYQCTFTYNRSFFETAGAVVFHLRNVNVSDLPKAPAFHGQKFVAFTTESPSNSIDDVRELPKSYFHWSLTYLSVSDVAFPYGGPWISRDAQKRGIPPLNWTYDTEEILRQKKIRGAIWFVSNCRTASGREWAVSALSRQFRIDVAGSCASNENFTNLCPHSNGSDCDSIFGQYYFYVAAENSICKEYISEKYWSRVHYPSVPIVMRRYIYETHVNATK